MGGKYSDPKPFVSITYSLGTLNYSQVFFQIWKLILEIFVNQFIYVTNEFRKHLPVMLMCNRTISRVTKITCITFIIRSTNKITCTRDRNYFFNCVQSFIVIFTFSIVILYLIFYVSIFKYYIILLIVISNPISIYVISINNYLYLEISIVITSFVL